MLLINLNMLAKNVQWSELECRNLKACGSKLYTSMNWKSQWSGGRPRPAGVSAGDDRGEGGARRGRQDRSLSLKFLAFHLWKLLPYRDYRLIGPFCLVQFSVSHTFRHSLYKGRHLLVYKVLSKVFLEVPRAGGPYYSCCAARQEEQEGNSLGGLRNLSIIFLNAISS